MKVIYVAGPFRAVNAWVQEQNVRHAERVALEIWQTGMAAVICPHTMSRFYQGAAPDEVWLEGDLELLRRCDAVYLLDGWRNSEGSIKEHGRAYYNGMPIFGDMVSLRAWLSGPSR